MKFESDPNSAIRPIAVPARSGAAMQARPRMTRCDPRPTGPWQFPPPESGTFFRQGEFFPANPRRPRRLTTTATDRAARRLTSWHRTT